MGPQGVHRLLERLHPEVLAQELDALQGAGQQLPVLHQPGPEGEGVRDGQVLLGCVLLGKDPTTQRFFDLGPPTQLDPPPGGEEVGDPHFGVNFGANIFGTLR